ncbi:MAG: hypothetical protein K6G85_06835 [Eubacterium sp.]|nr:hypothetical protein [Eubacterium sp.]
MQQYKLKMTLYSEKGALTSETMVRYCDSHEQAKDLYDEFEKMKYEGGLKMYKVELYVSAYKKITDIDAFFAQFEA